MTAGLSPSDKLIGRVLAERYEILHRLGEGAMGIVYKARHVKVGRVFAVKVLHTRTLQDAKVLRRFEREAELAGRLRHPNVIGVVDVGEVDGTRYMVMDFAEGPDLARLLDEAPMPPERIIRLARQMLDGLHHAHEHGMIHRDFKPENVIVERDAHGSETPRIVDFGIALLRDGGDAVDGKGRLTTNGLVLGTPHYMAPEQAVADPIDHRIDLFALGIVVYEMLSGRLPFDGSGAEVARANLLLDPPPINKRVPHLEVDPLLEAFARRLMAKKRTARPATAKAARELLDAIERDRQAAAPLLGVPVAKSGRHQAATESVSAEESAPPLQLDPPTTRMRQTPKQATPAPAMPSRSHTTGPAAQISASASAFDDSGAVWSATGGGAAPGAELAAAGGPVEFPMPERSAMPGAPPFAPEAGYAVAPMLPGAAGVPPGGYSAAGVPGGYGPPRRHRDTSLRTPLGWQTASMPGRRRSWLIGGLAVGAASVIAAAVLSLTGDPDDAAPAPAGDRVAITRAAAAPVPAAPMEAPAAALPPAPSAAPANAPPAALPSSPSPPSRANAAPASISGNPADAPSVDDAAHRSRAVEPAPNSRSVAAPASSTPKRIPPTPGRARKPIDAAPRATGEPAGDPAPTPPPVRVRPRATEAADADTSAPARAEPPPAIPTGVSAADLGKLFDEVHREIEQLPETSRHDLLDQLAMLNIMRAMRESQAARDDAAAQLSRLRQRARERRTAR